jgi:integrase
MASVDWREGRAYIRFYDSSREPKEKKVSLDLDAWTRREVKRYKRELVVLWEKGQWDPWTDRRPHKSKEIPTIGEALETYITEKTEAGKRGEAGGWTEATRAGKESVLWDWADRVGRGRQVTSLKHKDLYDYVHREDLALATRKGYRTHINAFRSWIKQQGYEMPDKVAPLKQQVRQPAYITEKELYAICEAHCEYMAETATHKHVTYYDAHRSGWMTRAWRLIFYQGLRRGELFRLKRSDIDTDQWTMRISGEQKNRRESTIPVTPPARDVLRPSLQIKSGARLFDRDDETRITRYFGQACKRCEAIEDPERADRLNVHSLRHSCAMYWKKKGASLADIRDLLRHQSYKTTEMYERMDPKGMADRFEEIA